MSSGKGITTQDLRHELWDTLQKVKSGEIEPRQAKAVADMADKIISTADLELRFAEMCDRLDSRDNGISPGPMLLAESK